MFGLDADLVKEKVSAVGKELHPRLTRGALIERRRGSDGTAGVGDLQHCSSRPGEDDRPVRTPRSTPASHDVAEWLWPAPHGVDLLEFPASEKPNPAAV